MATKSVKAILRIKITDLMVLKGFNSNWPENSGLKEMHSNTQQRLEWSPVGAITVLLTWQQQSRRNKLEHTMESVCNGHQ